MSVIYKIQNLCNGNIYVGSALNYPQRRKNHLSKLKNHKHHSQYLQNAWNKYGEQNFIFEILEYCIKENLIEREQYYIDTLNPKYNICRIAGSRLGMVHSEETKNKISENCKGMLGKFHSEKTKEKMRETWNRKNSLNPPRERNIKIKKKNKARNEPKKRTSLAEDHKKRISESLSGEKSNKAILTWEKVREIRKEYEEEQISQQKLADKYKVSRSCVQAIVDKKSWKLENKTIY